MSGDIFLKYNRSISVIMHFKQYLPSFTQSAVFTGRVARQANRLYVLRMTVRLAYSQLPLITRTADSSSSLHC